MTPLLIIILCLAVWRITSIVTSEAGPWDCFRNLRKWLRAGEFQSDDPDFDEFTEAELDWWLSIDKVENQGFFSKLLSCSLCTSVWVGAGLGWFGLCFPAITLFVAFPFALSAVSVLLNVICDALETA